MRSETTLSVDALATEVKRGRLVLIAGADLDGSLPWRSILGNALQFYLDLLPRTPELRDLQGLLAETAEVFSVSPQLAAVKLNLIQRELRSSVDRWQYRSINMGFRHDMARFVTGVNPSDIYRTLVLTNFPYILTTSLDHRLETAAKRSGVAELAYRSYSRESGSDVSATIYNEFPAIIHTHGMAGDVDLGSFPYSSESYRKSRRKYPGFQLAIQALLLRYGVLIMGFHADDPQLEDLKNDFDRASGWVDTAESERRVLLLPQDEITPAVEKEWNALGVAVAAHDGDLQSYAEALHSRAPRSLGSK